MVYASRATYGTKRADHHRRDLQMKPLRSDSAPYTLMIVGLLQGLSGTYVDDLLRCGNKAFSEIGKKTAETFEMAHEEHIPCTFTGFQLRRDDDGIV